MDISGNIQAFPNLGIHANSMEAYQLLHEGTLALVDAEEAGIRIDMDYCNGAIEELNVKISGLEELFYQSKFYKRWFLHNRKKKPNINSDTQLGKYIYDVLRIEPVKYTEKENPSTDEEALKALNIPELTTLLEIRRFTKARDTYLQAFIREQVDGFIHPSFNLHLVKTFRSSSDSPNFQNIPKRDEEIKKLVRKALKPRKGHLLMEVDYSGIEVRIAACYHKDPKMLKYIKDPQSDMHGDMAEQIYEIPDFNKSIKEHSYLRSASKNGFVFPQFYGDYFKNCALALACSWGGLPKNGKWGKGQGVLIDKENNIHLSDHLISKKLGSLDKFTKHLQKIEDHFWNVRFPVYKKWKDKLWYQYQKTGYIDSLTGFRYTGLMGKNDAINYPVQGSAFHCLLWSLIRLNLYLQHHKMETRIIGQIHDAIVLDVHPSEKKLIIQVLKSIMCDQLTQEWKWINVPIEVEIDAGEVDASWAELKTIKI